MMDGLQLTTEVKDVSRKFLLHGHGGWHGRWQFSSSSTLHQLDGLLHFHLVIEGDKLGLFRALAYYQPFLHIPLVEPVQPVYRGQERKHQRKG